MSLATSEFQYLRALVFRESAIVLADDHGYLIEARLSPVARSEGLADVGALTRALQRGSDGGLKRKVVEAMTTNETSFFRDLTPFEALRSTVLPELARARASERRLRIWSAACSTGQEACSLGMTLLEHHRDIATNWDVQILGTDLSVEMTERAKAGVYKQVEVNRGLPAPMMMRYFVRQGLHWHTGPQLRKMLEFRSMNLATPWPYLHQFDVVFLRNVLIYFDMETRRSIFTRLRSVIRKDGYLFLGAAESVREIDAAFECVRVGNTHFFRPRAQGNTHGP